MKFLLSILLLMFFLYLEGQKPSPNADVEKEIVILLDSAEINYDRGDFYVSEGFAKKALAKSNEIGFLAGRGYSNLYLGNIKGQLARFSESLNLIESARKDAVAMNDLFLQSEVSIAKTKTYTYFGMWKDALEEQKNSLQIINKIHNPKNANKQKLKAYINVLFIYFYTKKIDLLNVSIGQTKELLNTIREPNVSALDLSSFYFFMGQVALSYNQYEKAEIWFVKSLTMSKTRKLKYLGFTYMGIGDVKANVKQKDSAMIYYSKAVENMQSLHLDVSINMAYLRIADLYHSLGNTKKENEFRSMVLVSHLELSKRYDIDHNAVVSSIVKEEKEETQKNASRYIFGLLALALVSGAALWYYSYSKQSAAKRKLLMQNEIIAESEAEAIFLKQQINGAFEEVIQLAKENNPEFLTRFKEVYPQFVSALLQLNPGLQASELTFCAYLYLNFSSKDIAQYTFVTVRAVQLRKNRLRKKFNISSDTDIYVWIQQLG